MTVHEYSNNLTISQSKGKLPSLPFSDIKELVLGKRYELSIHFATSEEAQKLNITYRGKDYIPNTLSFPYSKSLGEIILCEEAMKKQYIEFGLSYRDYVIYILIHSMLHLKGFKHGSTMESKEVYFLNKLIRSTISKNEKKHSSRY
jgi:probable rRNA maturation factor